MYILSYFDINVNIQIVKMCKKIHKKAAKLKEFYIKIADTMTINRQKSSQQNIERR